MRAERELPPERVGELLESGEAEVVDMRSSPIFIVGTPRSGASLLRDLLRSHPRLAFGYESYFVPKLYRAHGDPRTDRAARALAARILRLSWVRRWGLELDPSSLAHHRSYASLVAAIYGELARIEGKPRWGDKTPQYVAEIPTLIELFPEAKILHVYRDGRDVALAWLKTPYGPQNLFTAASAWRELVTTGRSDGARLPPSSYTEIRYEALLTRPEETMRRVCQFVDEPFTADVLRPTLLPPSSSRQLVGKRPMRALAGEAAIASSNVGNWKGAMPPTDRSLFESLAGDLLEELGYETEGVGRRVSGLERIAWGAHHRAGRALSRLNSRATWQPATLALMAEARIRRWIHGASSRPNSRVREKTTG
jgi:hypothetical protein